MSGTIVTFIIQLVSGAFAGATTGMALKDGKLNPPPNTTFLWNSIVGAIGGLGGGQALQALVPAFAGSAGGELDLTSMLYAFGTGGIAGSILTGIVGFVKNKMT